MEMKHARTFEFFFHFTYVEKQRSKKTRTMESTLNPRRNYNYNLIPNRKPYPDPVNK